MNKEKFTKGFILSTMIGLYIIVSLISTLHVIEFFEMSNPRWLAISLAIAFEIGAAASLASIIVLEKTSKTLVWSLFILLTAMQVQGNMFYAYTHLENFQDWIELFGLQEEEPITQKRILSIVSGAILPVIALGFIKSLVDYIKPDQAKEELTETILQEQPITQLEEVQRVEELTNLPSEPTADISENLETRDVISESTQSDEIINTTDEVTPPTVNEAKIGKVAVEQKSSQTAPTKRYFYKP